MTEPTIQISPLPVAEEIALVLIQWLFATTGTPTDYNIGSIIRTYSEAIGSVEEVEGISAQAQALQALVYSAYTAFGITPYSATGAIGNVTFSTLSSAPLPTGQSVLIPSGAIIQTPTSIQFVTTSNVILVSGTTSVVAPIQAVQLGSAGNVPANTINQIVSGLAYPLAVTNTLPTTGGADAETASETLARFTAYVQSLGLCSPTAIAGAVIGVSYLQETVKYSTCYEPWVTEVNMGDLMPDAGFQVIIDNGSGSASTNLITTVYNYLSTGGIAGFRPAGVPYSVLAVTPVPASVVVVASSINPSIAPAIQTAVIQAIAAYFDSLGFGISCQYTQLVAAISNVTFGQLTSLSVFLLDQYGNPVTTTITASPVSRIILSGAAVTIN